MLELTGLKPLVTEGSNLRVPGEWRCLVERTEFVVGVQDGLLFLGQLGAGFSRFLAIDGTASQSLMRSHVVRGGVREDGHLTIDCRGIEVEIQGCL